MPVESKSTDITPALLPTKMPLLSDIPATECLCTHVIIQFTRVMPRFILRIYAHPSISLSFRTVVPSLPPFLLKLLSEYDQLNLYPNDLIGNKRATLQFKWQNGKGDLISVSEQADGKWGRKRDGDKRKGRNRN